MATGASGTSGASRQLPSVDAYRSLFDGGPLPTLVLDRSSQGILAVNEAAVQHYGYPRDELLRFTLDHLLAPDDPESEEALLALAPGATRELHRTRDGVVRIVETTRRDVEFDGRDALMVVVLDVTERLRTERDLRLTEQRLREVQKLEALGALARGVAQEFNDLLSIMISYATIAMQSLPADHAVHEDVAEIHRAGVRAAEITRKLLAFSRDQRSAPREVDLHALLRDTEGVLRVLAGDRVQLVVSAGSALGRVRADPLQLERVLTNLVVNAREAMPDGGSLWIETSDVDLDAPHAARHPGLEPGPHLLLVVRDTGGGMDERTLARVFEPYFTTKEPGRGAGLGLSTVFGIIQRSGGFIVGASEIAQGTTFRIYLPLWRETGVASARPSHEAV